MTITKNYNSLLTLSEYEIGNVYSFYLGNYHLSYPNHFNKKSVEKYIEVLNDVINSNQEFTNSDGKYFNYTRAIGIVVDKKESDINNSIDTITVMFKTLYQGYIFVHYVVNTHNVFTNGKNLVLPTAVINC